MCSDGHVFEPFQEDKAVKIDGKWWVPCYCGALYRNDEYTIRFAVGLPKWVLDAST